MDQPKNVPLSEILKSKQSLDQIEDDEPKKKSREDWRKAKELEEMRKAGTAPAAVDEEGRDINPHIPQYISAAPWYYGSSGPTLKHQRPQPEKQQEFSKLHEWYRKGVDQTKAATKYRKGACTNCGAITHKAKECMDRPRKIGAKYTGAAIAHDEYEQPDLSLDFDGKRDRWAGYDPSEHRAIVEEYQKIEEAKREMRAQKLSAEGKEGDAVEHDDLDDDEDEDKYVDEVDMPGTKVDSKQRITVRNLRIREDTAKYLRNLDPNSAYYDPKTRSMRDNPNAGTSKELDNEYKGENFVRFTGDTGKHGEAQLFAWEAYEKGVDVHLLAEPTKLEMLEREYKQHKEEFKGKVKSDVLQRYGGEEHLDAPPKALLLAQTEDYVEYSRTGKILKGAEKPVVRSKYEEDIYPNNHTSVWGSFWKDGQWGYKCCHSFIKNSYCVGETGRINIGKIEVSQNQLEKDTQAAEAISEPKEVKDNTDSSSESSSSSSSSSEDDSETTKKEARRKKKRSKKKKRKDMKKKSRAEKKNKETEEDKLKIALQKEEEQQREAERLLAMDERKRPYNSMYDAKKLTDEEMEAYYMKKRRDEDPMAQFLS
ncbi:pre-mRNA-splicing factor Slu7 [Frankliniella occidentalis]|uniref:Pre-mRNA-splicing factor SLU7 n=1 Tax=Frankliniella occidentalis TaxID=133901 RepID=A0A6J1TBZ8_FRAOC|nr:pre-mRNA-splicing factor Slu7 [Frankliniella occidentalis]XP_026290307.1 pre-mRNA-splicing factor Slu7 [Frankliniella occidentalis]XP_026290308.1 pre-mRNA-splicing factor Slu7 [Frankliniella occidentalis]XP_052128225.1 pre-mRNA-splicing factor Slu7 [Frankliniella occidentalis]